MEGMSATKPLDPLAAFVADEKRVEAWVAYRRGQCTHAPRDVLRCPECKWLALLADREAKLTRKTEEAERQYDENVELIAKLAAAEAKLAEAMKLPDAFTAMIVRMGEKAAGALGRHPDPQINRIRTSSTGDCEVTVESLARDYRTVSATLREVEALRDELQASVELSPTVARAAVVMWLDAILRPSTTNNKPTSAFCAEANHVLCAGYWEELSSRGPCECSCHGASTTTASEEGQP